MSETSLWLNCQYLNNIGTWFYNKYLFSPIDYWGAIHLGAAATTRTVVDFRECKARVHFMFAMQCRRPVDIVIQQPQTYIYGASRKITYGANTTFQQVSYFISAEPFYATSASNLITDINT